MIQAGARFRTTVDGRRDRGRPTTAARGAAPSIENADVLAAALGIHSVEARHAAYLNGLNNASPFPAATDTPLTPDEVLAIAGPFIVGDGDGGERGAGGRQT